MSRLMRKFGALLAVVAAVLGPIQPAYAGDFAKGLIVGKQVGRVYVDTSPVTNTPVVLHNAPSGATCAWYLDGTANGSTSCTSYTPSVPDVGKVLTVKVTTSSGSIALANAGAVGNPYAVTLNSSLFTSTTDLTPVSQFIDGWTLDLYLTGLTPAGDTSKYVFGSIPGSAKLSFLDTRPAYDASGNATTVVDTIYATSYLREPSPNDTLPTESSGSGLFLGSLTASDYVFNSDTPGVATVGAGLYTDANGVASLAGSASVSGTSTRPYPRPIGAWITEPGVLLDGTQDVTFEFFAGQAYGRNGKPLAALSISMGDGSHAAVTHFGTLAQSARLLKTSCTATNGSNVLTGCTSTAGFIAGERISVFGIPGQPKIASIDSSSQMTLAATGTVTTTLNSSTISVTNSTVNAGEGLGDGLFVGAKVNCSTINSGTDATITVEPTTAGLTTASSKTTAAPFTINTSTTTAASNTSCTFKHVYQGTTGTVTVTAGNPVPTWQVTFTAAEIATFSDGAINLRAKGYPAVGDVILDSQTGADGTGLDWQGQAFSSNGSDVSPNLHNLTAWKDTAGNYTPKWAWVSGSGSAGASPAVQTTSADPGTTAYYASIGAACAGLKTYFNANKGHNNANGGVIYVKAGTQAGVGTAMTSCTSKSGPLLLVAPDPAASAMTVILQQGGTNTIGPMTKFYGVKYNPTSTGYTGADSAVTTGLLSSNIIFERSWLTSTVSGIPAITAFGAMYYINDLIEESAADSAFLRPYSTASAAVAMAAGNTINGGTVTSAFPQWQVFNAVGNVSFAVNLVNPSVWATSRNYVQPLSYAVAYNKFMGTRAAVGFNTGTIINLLMANNVIEEINIAAGALPALQISADNNNSPASNIVRHYETVAGQRTNIQYLEGVPSAYGTATPGTAGSMVNGNYKFQIVYALTGTPSVETATDGPSSTVAVGGNGTNGSFSIVLPKDDFHVDNIYVTSLAGATPDHLAVATIGGTGGVTATGVATNQTIVVTSVGSAQAITSSLPGHNELKVQFIQRFSLDENLNMKSDTYSGSGASVSGARVGNWGGLWRTGNIGMVSAAALAAGGVGPGEIVAPYSVNGTNGLSDNSIIVYKSDRSWGGAGNATPLAPALNIGMGWYCPNVATMTTPLNRVPSGLAAWPFDIDGRARLNDGTGQAGAYEKGCSTF